MASTEKEPSPKQNTKIFFAKKTLLQSHDGAERAVMIYSFLATCKLNGINPQHWLKDTLSKLPDCPANRLHELLPANEKR